MKTSVLQPSRRLAFFVPSMRGGGAERVMLKLAEGFSCAGYSVDLILARASGPLLEQIHSSVRVVDLGRDRVLFALPGLVQYLRRERPFSLLAAMDHTNVIAIWARWLSGVHVRTFVSVHNSLHRPGQPTSSFRWRVLQASIRQYYPSADGIVAVSKGVAGQVAEALDLPLDRINVIYNPVVTPDIPKLAAAPVSHPWFSDRGTPVIVAAGRLEVQKDYPTLLSAFAQVVKRRPARLLILGEGTERAVLETMIKKLKISNCVELLGFTDNPYAYMARASLFVLSSAWEGFGNVLVEALSLGIPVVATDCYCGPSEILEGGKYGKLVPVGASHELADCILSSLAGDRLSSEVLQKRSSEFTLQNSLIGYKCLLLGR